MEITWRDKTITCEEGTTLFDISKQVEKEYEKFHSVFLDYFQYILLPSQVPATALL